jgi:hypothetical protein
MLQSLQVADHKFLISVALLRKRTLELILPPKVILDMEVELRVDGFHLALGA